MAPQLVSLLPVSFCLVVALLALGTHAQGVTVVAHVPFLSQVPPTTTSPGLAGFKDRFKQAYQGSLQYINDQTGAGLGAAPSIKSVVPKWSYTAASATATFPYTAEWLGPLQYLVAVPTTLYFYNNATSSAGYKLINIYEALPEGTTFTILAAAPPSPPSTGTPPPSPPPPIFPKMPAPPPGNLTALRIASTLSSPDIPLQSDTVAFAKFLDTYFKSFAAMMDCAAKYGNSSVFDTADGVSNSTLIQELCLANSTLGGGNSTGFPVRPSSYNVTQELVRDPTPTPARRLHQTAPAGFFWQVTIVAIYVQVDTAVVEVYVTSQALVVNGQKIIIVEVLVFSSLSLAQVAAIIISGGGFVPVTPDSPAYGSDSGTVTGRRLIERRSAALPAAAAADIKWADAEPSDIAYGSDKSLYEVFSVAADYYTAGSACAARGAKLANYGSESSQIFIDILCDSAAGMQCWVEGNANSACSAVSMATVHPTDCSGQKSFVCVKDKSAITTRTVMSNSASVAEIAAQKPSDVAIDTNKVLYEIFNTPVNYHTAGSVCLARGAQLVNYGSEAARVFIDVLCESATGSTCWVEGNKAGRCSMVKSSDMHQVSCTGLQPFVCSKTHAATKN